MSKDQKQKIQYLLTQYIEGLASPKEEALLFQLLDEEKDNNEWEQVVEELMAAENEFETYSPQQWEPVIEGILNRKQGEEERGKIRQFSNLYRWVAAASVIFLLSIGSYFYFNKITQKQIATTETQKQRFKNDIAPGHAGAILTLSNGQEIILDSAHNGALAKQGDAEVIKENGQLAYNSQGNTSEIVYNTMATPKGRQYSLILSDGSKVWLNAASSITYPTTFAGNERKVTITGEAYFEVAHNAAMPFVVQKNDVSVQVLGTHFNVNSYDDEAEMKITLLEGSVKVTNGNKTNLLKPGQQAILKQSPDEKEIKIINADVDEVIAWKNGRFSFESMDIESIMRQMARWYNVEIEYRDKIIDKYTVKITRDVPVSEVFKYIEMSGGVHFTIDGNKIVVRK